MLSIGGTAIQSVMKIKKIKKGVWGIQKTIENPVRILFTGEENCSKKEERVSSILNNLLEIYREYLPDTFNNVNPDELEIETIEVNLRLHIDMGNKIEAIFFAALTSLYLLLQKKKTEMQAEIEYLLPLNFIVINRKSKENIILAILVDPEANEEKHKTNAEVLTLTKVGSDGVRVLKLGGKPTGISLIKNILEESLKIVGRISDEYIGFVEDDEKKTLRIF